MKEFTPKPESNLELISKKSDVRWLRFKQEEIISLIRFALTQGDKQPLLVVYCEKGKEKPCCAHEGLKAKSFKTNGLTTTIAFYNPAPESGNTFRFKWRSGEKKSDTSGTFISYIEVDPAYFPLDDYLTFKKSPQRPPQGFAMLKDTCEA